MTAPKYKTELGFAFVMSVLGIIYLKILHSKEYEQDLARHSYLFSIETSS